MALISKSYAKKEWPRKELKAALYGQALNRRPDYILPVQIDETRLEELPEDLAYLMIKDGVDSVCDTIIKRLKRG